MTDIYKTPESELTTPSNLEGYGSLERGLSGQFEFSIGDIMKESWEKTRGAKGTVWFAIFLYFVIVVPVSIVVPLVFELAGFPSQIVPGQQVTPAIITGILLSQLVMGALLIPAGAGIFMLGVKLASGVPVTGMEALKYYSKIVPLVITMILMYIFVFIGLLLFVIPGIYLMVAYYLSMPLVLDKGLSPWQALETSRKAVSKCWFRFVGLGIVMLLIMLVAMIPLGIGLIWALPFMVIALGMVYRNIFGLSSTTAA